MTFGLLGALAAAACYGIAAVLQALGVRRVASTRGSQRAGGGFDGLVRDLAGQWTYVAGLALDGIGFASSVVALRTLPLFAVQAAIASSIAVTALLAHWFLDVALRRVELFAMAVLGAGLLLLALSAQPERAETASAWLRLMLVAALGAVLVLAIGAARVPARYAAAACAAVSGLAFTGMGVAARILVLPDPLWRVALAPVALALLGYGVIGLLLYAAALERGSVTTVTAILFAVETVLPAALGLALLGDRARHGYAVAAAAGFICTVGAALALAGRAEVPPVDAPTTER
ncbi:MAG: hypothetical protein ABI912_06155 [Actinomycetota bacterium]